MLATVELDLDARLRELHSQGLSQRDIAAEIGYSQRWVCYRAKQLGLRANGYHSAASRGKRSKSARIGHTLRRLRDVEFGKVRELFYPLESGQIPAHGYPLFSALCRAGWPIHGETAYQVLGLPSGILVRCPAERVATLLGGQRRFRVHREPVLLDHPREQAMAPAGRLRSRLVVIKNATDERLMRAAVAERLDSLVVKARIEVGKRGIIQISGRVIVGFEVRLEGLSPRHSLRVQAAGLGGRNRFGCGVFLPC